MANKKKAYSGGRHRTLHPRVDSLPLYPTQYGSDTTTFSLIYAGEGRHPQAMERTGSRGGGGLVVVGEVDLGAGTVHRGVKTLSCGGGVEVDPTRDSMCTREEGWLHPQLRWVDQKARLQCDLIRGRRCSESVAVQGGFVVVAGMRHAKLPAMVGRTWEELPVVVGSRRVTVEGSGTWREQWRRRKA